ncbi:hypothetical protein RMSM_00555 [Rhodopirellula maiorica SM1]|uniref:Uncharacterized protein n=1 Tax=Rhodopirellula maiorica SM1 TaxID=1265738 RepID=M5RTB1_9BACT|nr:hypothetical protein RMSM_00555 [Rhodopirellula maiorica SM1]
MLMTITTVARAGSIDNIVIDIELSEPTVINGDIVFAKITFYNSGDEAVDMETFDPHRHIDVYTQDVIWKPHAIVGHKELRSEFEKWGRNTRLEPKQSDCHVVMVRILDLERSSRDSTIDLNFLVRILEPTTAKAQHGLVIRNHAEVTSPPPRRFSRIAGRIIEVPIAGHLLAPIDRKRSAEDKEIGWLFGQIHGGTNNWFHRYSAEKMDPFPGLLNQAVFPLPELDRWRIYRERDVNRDAVLFRVMSLSIAYDVMNTRGLSAEKFFQTMTRYMQDSSPIEQWWLNEQMRINLEKRGKSALAELFAKENAKQSLCERKGFGSSKKGTKPSDKIRADFQLADERIIDGDVMLAEITVRSLRDEEITYEDRKIEDEIIVYFPAGKNVGNPVVNRYRINYGLNVSKVSIPRLLKGAAKTRTMIRLHNMFPGEDYDSLDQRFHLMEVAFKMKFRGGFGTRKAEITEATSVGEISGMGARVAVDRGLRAQKVKLPYDNEQRRIDENLFTLIHGGYKIGYGFQKQFLQIEKVPGLLDSNRFPFDSLDQWKMVRENMRDGSTLARLVDVSLAFDDLNRPSNDSISVFEGMVKLIEKSSRIEKAWLFDSLYQQLCSTDGVSTETIIAIEELKTQYLQTLEQEEQKEEVKQHVK